MALPGETYLKFGPYLDLMTGVHTALSVNEGIIKVVGAEATGKSAFCRQLADELEAEGLEVIYFDTPPESGEYLHQRIQSQLGLDKSKNFNRTLSDYLLAKKPPHNKLVVIYDDAEKIPKDIFILIRLLNNIHDHSETLVSQIICGTKRLDERFDDPDLRSLTQYLNQSFTLEPMDRAALDDFYSGYRKTHGHAARDMNSKQITDLFIKGKGQPGKTLELLDEFFTPEAAPVAAAPAPAVTAAPAPQSPSAPQSLGAAPASTASLEREVSAILDEDYDDSPGYGPVYFKLALSLLVIVATVVLMVVLSGNDESAGNRLPEILADESPLYLDEVATVEVSDDTAIDTPAEIDEQAAVGRLLVEIDEVIETATLPPDPQPVEPDVSEAPVVAIGETIDAAMPEPVEEIVNVQVAVPVEEPVEEESVDDTPPLPAADVTITTLLAGWADAWQAGDFSGYMAAYHDEFVSPYHDSRDVWLEERRARIDGVSGISTGVDRLEFTAVDDSEATVRFWLHYARGSYADDTLKEMQLRRIGDNWRITFERNLEIITAD